MEVDVSLYTRYVWRTIGLVFLLLLLVVAVFLSRGRIMQLLSPAADAPSTALVKAVVEDYFDGRLAADDPRITPRMAADVERLAQLPPGAFIAFGEEPRVIALSPEDAPTWARLVGSARYQAPAGGVFLGEVTVEVVKEGDTWKVDRILVRPLMSVEP